MSTTPLHRHCATGVRQDVPKGIEDIGRCGNPPAATDRQRIARAA